MFLGSEIFKKEVMQKIDSTFSESRSKEIIKQKMKKTFLESISKNNFSKKILKKGGICK